MDFLELTVSLKELLQDAADNLKSSAHRIFMAKTVLALGPSGQRKAERELGWNRETIRKGQREYKFGIIQPDNFSKRGRKKAEEHLTNLLKDIKTIVDPISQADPTFRTTQIYTPLTAIEVRNRLIKQIGYMDEQLPTIRTINTKLNKLGYRLQTVAKSKPIKKIKETDAIFEQVHKLNQEADKTEGMLRLSMDTKAKIKVGLFSRGGKNRQGITAIDHDYNPEKILTPFGIFLPAYDDIFFYLTESKVTSDFMIDALENLWSTLKERFNPHSLLINLDNGPENHSHRTQFIKRLVEFANSHNVTIRLAYYPPYHSKYNPIERVWGILENHWNGELLEDVEKILGLAMTMKWNGKHPIVQLIKKVYQTGVTLTKKAMKVYEGMIKRLAGLEKWFVDILPSTA